MVLNTTFNDISIISWWSVLLVEETGVPGVNYRPVASHWQTLLCCINYSLIVLSKVVEFERTTLMIIDTDCNGRCKSNYHMITTILTQLWVTFALYLISVVIVVTLPCALTLSMLMGLFHSASCHFLTVNQFNLLRSYLFLQINL